MKNDTVYLTHIIECIKYIQEYTRTGEEDFYKQRIIQDAVIRNLEVIGEATKNISREYRNQHPDIPWREMAGLRDVLIHDYLGIDKPIVWGVVKNELPRLLIQIEEQMNK